MKVFTVIVKQIQVSKAFAVMTFLSNLPIVKLGTVLEVSEERSEGNLRRVHVVNPIEGWVTAHRDGIDYLMPGRNSDNPEIARMQREQYRLQTKVKLLDYDRNRLVRDRDALLASAYTSHAYKDFAEKSKHLMYGNPKNMDEDGGFLGTPVAKWKTRLAKGFMLLYYVVFGVLYFPWSTRVLYLISSKSETGQIMVRQLIEIGAYIFFATYLLAAMFTAWPYWGTDSCIGGNFVTQYFSSSLCLYNEYGHSFQSWGYAWVAGGITFAINTWTWAAYVAWHTRKNVYKNKAMSQSKASSEFIRAELRLLFLGRSRYAHDPSFPVQVLVLLLVPWVVAMPVLLLAHWFLTSHVALSCVAIYTTIPNPKTWCEEDVGLGAGIYFDNGKNGSCCHSVDTTDSVSALLGLLTGNVLFAYGIFITIVSFLVNNLGNEPRGHDVKEGWYMLQNPVSLNYIHGFKTESKGIEYHYSENFARTGGIFFEKVGKGVYTIHSAKTHSRLIYRRRAGTKKASLYDHKEFKCVAQRDGTFALRLVSAGMGKLNHGLYVSRVAVKKESGVGHNNTLKLRLRDDAAVPLNARFYLVRNPHAWTAKEKTISLAPAVVRRERSNSPSPSSSRPSAKTNKPVQQGKKKKQVLSINSHGSGLGVPLLSDVGQGTNSPV